jgi:hypothetical protein
VNIHIKLIALCIMGMGINIFAAQTPSKNVPNPRLLSLAPAEVTVSGDLKSAHERKEKAEKKARPEINFPIARSRGEGEFGPYTTYYSVLGSGYAYNVTRFVKKDEYFDTSRHAYYKRDQKMRRFGLLAKVWELQQKK